MCRKCHVMHSNSNPDCMCVNVCLCTAFFRDAKTQITIRKNIVISCAISSITNAGDTAIKISHGLVSEYRKGKWISNDLECCCSQYFWLHWIKSAPHDIFSILLELREWTFPSDSRSKDTQYSNAQWDSKGNRSFASNGLCITKCLNCCNV